jgi:hypothetical protein
MGKISRRERKLANKTMDRLDDVRHRSKLEDMDPTKSYKRKIVHTNIPWPLELINMGRSDIIILIIIAIILIIGSIVAIVWFLFRWLTGVIA